MLMIPHFTLSIDQKFTPTATSFSSWYSLWGHKTLKLCSVEVADLSYFRKSVCLLSSNRPEPISWHVRWTATLAKRSACPAVLDRLLKSLWGHKVVLMHLWKAGLILLIIACRAVSEEQKGTHVFTCIFTPMWKSWRFPAFTEITIERCLGNYEREAL